MKIDQWTKVVQQFIDPIFHSIENYFKINYAIRSTQKSQK